MRLALVSRLVLGLVAGVAAASIADVPQAIAAGAGSVHFDFDFRHGDMGWAGSYADFPADVSDFNFPPTVGWAPLSERSASGRGGLRMMGGNQFDSLFLFAKYRIDGLEPRRSYDLTFGVRLATRRRRDAMSFGDDWLKVGASAIEPVAVDVGGWLETNIDHGIQANDGADAIVLDRIGVGSEYDERPWRLQRQRVSNARRPFRATADGEGALWLLIGIDSANNAAVAPAWFERVHVRATPTRTWITTRRVR